MTGKIRPSGELTRAILLAFAGGVVAAVAAMFIPTSLLESFTGATGLSELIPATAAPLGGTARATIAFASGAIMLLLLLSFALRNRVANSKATGGSGATRGNEGGQFGLNLGERLNDFKARFGKFPRPAMPWDRRDGDITDLRDLPKLRNNDAHPDAPARRPISALTDLAEANLVPPSPGIAATSPPHIEVNEEAPRPAFGRPAAAEIFASDDAVAFGAADPVRPSLSPAARTTQAEARPTTPLAASPIAASPVATSPIAASSTARPTSPSLAEMVAQMESAVALRKQQLQELEKITAMIAIDKAAAVAAPTADAIRTSAAAYEPTAQLTPPEKTVLEIVPGSPLKQEEDEMDAALNAALATLQRMNRSAS